MPELVNFKPFQRHLFWTLWIIAVTLTAFVTGIMYWVYSSQILSDAQQELMGIATKTASLIPVETHERLQKPEDQNSSDYKLLELYLQSVMSGNPKVNDIYTLRPTGTPHKMVFVVSGADTEDANGDGLIDETEQKAMLGEGYDTKDYPELEAGLRAPSYDRQITYDKWGSWISGYAPLKDAGGAVVGIVGVDFATEEIARQRNGIFLTLLYFNLGLLLPFALMCYLITRMVAKPYKAFAHAVQKFVYGDTAFRLKPKGSKEEKLVSGMYNMLADELTKPKEKK